MKRAREWEDQPQLEDVSSAEPPSVIESKEEAELERPAARVRCPYLDTVSRQMIDFDSEKLCSQTLSNRNVYVCLVCGKFFEGRGKHTPAYTHSLQSNHYVFMNLESARSFCLPDGYEVLDRSLSDVQRCLSPSFSLREIARLDRSRAFARDVHGATYLPGFVGLNNLNCTDDVNVVLHLLSHVAPFRDFFLQQRLYAHSPSKLVKEFGLVMRKLWSHDNFKSTVSPQELVQTMSVDSKRKFSIGVRSDVLELLVWLLASLQRGLDKKPKTSSKEPSAIYEPFQGTIEVTTMTKKLVDSIEEQNFLEKAKDDVVQQAMKTADGWVSARSEVPFTFLSLDIPPCPLFRDSHGGLVIPQVPLFQLLKKFDGETWADQVTKDAHLRKQYRIKKLPRYLILHLARFTKNNFSLEKNPTIVTFPVRNLDMKHYLCASEDNEHFAEMMRRVEACPSSAEIATWDDEQLKSCIRTLGSPLHVSELASLLERRPSRSDKDSSNDDLHQDLLRIARRVVERVELFKSTKYDLVANICHESADAGNGVDVGESNSVEYMPKVRKASGTAAAVDDVINRGSYKIHIPFKPAQQWYDVQDLHVMETSPQLIGVSESYILVYEKKLSHKTAKASETNTATTEPR